jgi:hypothetical protein
MSSDAYQSLTPEEIKTFKDLYEDRVYNAAGARGDARAELAAARQLLDAVINTGLAPTGDGGVGNVSRPALDWSDSSLAAAALAEAERNGPRSGRVTRSLKKAGGEGNDMLQGALIILTALVAVAGFFGYRAWFGEEGEAAEAEPVEAAAVMTATVTIDVGGTATPAPTLAAELLADIVDSSGVRTPLVAPRTLEIAGVSFVVQPVQVKSGDWPRPYEERAASWVYGTSVNYVIGLEATPANKALVTSLQAGQELLLRMSTGLLYRFAYVDAVMVAPQASEIFRQSRPGMTLVLLGDDRERRLAVRSGYIPESDLGLAPVQDEIKAAVGEVAVLNEAVQVVCLGNRLLSKPGPPPGYVYQAVEYRVENVSAVEVSGGNFSHHLESGGMRYPIVAVPHEVNPWPILPETLAGGDVFHTVAIYAVPEMALAEGLTWEFSAGPDGAQARVGLPAYSGRLAETVELTGARTMDGYLTATFGISAALHSLELGPADIELTGGRLRADGNVFPWRVPAGGAGQFTLLAEPVRDGPLTVAILEHGFEFTLSGDETEAQ